MMFDNLFVMLGPASSSLLLVGALAFGIALHFLTRDRLLPHPSPELLERTA
jgi:hypothetical protein